MTFGWTELLLSAVAVIAFLVWILPRLVRRRKVMADQSYTSQILVATGADGLQWTTATG